MLLEILLEIVILYQIVSALIGDPKTQYGLEPQIQNRRVDSPGRMQAHWIIKVSLKSYYEKGY